MIANIFSIVLFILGLYLVVTGVPKAKEKVRQNKGLSPSAEISGLDPAVWGILIKSRAGIGIILILIAVSIQAPPVKEAIFGSKSNSSNPDSSNVTPSKDSTH